MLKQLAPIAVMPPSPKKIAWMAKAMEMARMDAQGPRTMAAMATPTACPVVPPGRGRLNIIMMKEKAAKTESKGTMRVWTRRSTRRSEVYQKGADPAYSATQVDGLRYPSGMCMPSRQHHTKRRAAANAGSRRGGWVE